MRYTSNLERETRRLRAKRERDRAFTVALVWLMVGLLIAILPMILVK